VAIDVIEHCADHRLSPADLVGRPTPKQRAERRADARSQQNQPRFPESQVPVFDDERQDKSDQPKVKEIEHVADRCGAGNQPLVFRQPRLFL
jgi:hypothetical protein